MGWDALLDAAMERENTEAEIRAEKIQEAMSTERHNPLNWLNFFEAISNSSFTKEEGIKFEQLLKAKDVKALDMLIDLSTNYQLHFIEKDLDDE
jgi:hypothetical protein